MSTVNSTNSNVIISCLNELKQQDEDINLLLDTSIKNNGEINALTKELSELKELYDEMIDIHEQDLCDYIHEHGDDEILTIPFHVKLVKLQAEGLFFNCKCKEIRNLDYIDISNCDNLICMFARCSNLRKIDLSGLNTSNVTDMSHMFECCHSLTEVNFGDHFFNSNVRNVKGMFHNCTDLKHLDLSSFIIKRCDISNMFENCSSLELLDISNIDLLTSTKIDDMFKGCSSLISVKLQASAMCYRNGFYKSRLFDCKTLESLYVANNKN